MSNLIMLIAAGVAAFVFFKLFSTLGTRTGNEKNPSDIFKPKELIQNEDSKVVELRPVPSKKPKTAPIEAVKIEPEVKQNPAISVEIAEALKSVLAIDKNFDAEHFLEGAQSAYEMILNAFALEDLAQLKMLLSNDVYENFAAAIKERQANTQKLHTTLIGIDKVQLLEVNLKGSTAELTVQFNAKLNHVTKDAAGEVVSGDPLAILDIVDIWSFSRNLKSNNPNWALSATESMDDTFA